MVLFPPGTRDVSVPDFQNGPVARSASPSVGISLSFGGGEADPAFPSVTEVKEGHAVAQLLEALCYKPEGRGFDSRWCHWNFSGRTIALELTQPLTEMIIRNISWGIKAAGA